MSWVLALLLLAIGKTAVGQCDYVYVAQPPAGQLICDPFPINRLQLVCSLFVQQIPDRLTIQWFFSTTPISGLQVGQVSARLLRQVDFQVVRPDTFTSRIVVSNPPIGFYFCQPLLDIDPRPLVRSNVAQLQRPLINLRPCLVDEFQNVSVPFCALEGVPLDQIITPAPGNDTDDIQYITPTALNQVTPTPAVQANINDGNNAGLIGGVVVAAIIIIAMAIVAAVGFIVFYLIWKKKHNSKFPRTFNSRRVSNEQTRYAIPVANVTTDAHNDQESSLIPPNKPPPRLRGFSNNRATDYQYNRLKRPTSNARKNNSRERVTTGTSDTSAYYIIPEHNDNRVAYYGEFNEELLDDPYIDDSESLVYTDSHYGAESDIHLQQQKKQQEFVRSSSLELQSDEEDKLAREAASTANAGNQMARSRHNYQNCAVLSRTPEDVSNIGSTPYYQEIVATRELKTEYTSADVLESTAL